MDATDFLNKFASLVSLHKWVEHVESTCPAIGRDVLPLSAQEVYDDQTKADNKPRVYETEEAGYVVVAAWGDDDKDPLMRLVCWAQCGESKFMKVAAGWWKANNPAWQKDKTDG